MVCPFFFNFLLFALVFGKGASSQWMRCILVKLVTADDRTAIWEMHSPLAGRSTGHCSALDIPVYSVHHCTGCFALYWALHLAFQLHCVRTELVTGHWAFQLQCTGRVRYKDKLSKHCCCKLTNPSLNQPGLLSLRLADSMDSSKVFKGKFLVIFQMNVS